MCVHEYHLSFRSVCQHTLVAEEDDAISWVISLLELRVRQ